MKIKLICQSCGKEFETDYKFRNKKYCNRECYIKSGIKGKSKEKDKYEIRKCVECGKSFEIRKKQPNKLCSNECRLKWNKKHTNERIEKSIKGQIKKHGQYFFKTNSFKEKLDKKSHSEKIKKYFNSEKYKNNIKLQQFNSAKERVEKQGYEFINFNGKKVTMKCKKCNNIFSHSQFFREYPFICRKCNPLPSNNNLNIFMEFILNNLNVNYIKNDRTVLEGKEIDYIIGNIGFELNGNYYHSEIHGSKDKKYHLEKTKLAEKKNIKLIHIFEDEIIKNPEIVKSRIINLIGKTKNRIYARKCYIKEISPSISKEFLNKNHIQGNVNAKIKLGLFYNNELVSVMTFSVKRKCTGNDSKSNEYELLRFSNKLNTNVIGGFSKLLKYFIKKYKPIKLLTYSDIRWSGINIINNVYSKNGFKLKHISPPNYWYIKIGDFMNRKHRYSFRKDILVKEGYNPMNTEWEIMQIKKYDRIWDCGNLVYEFEDI